MIGQKQPGEIFPFNYDFRAQLAGAEIANVAEVFNDKRGGGAALVNNGQAYAAGFVTIYWGGGEDGGTYLTTVRINDTAGALHELDGEVLVKEIGFQVPELETTYLSADEYIARTTREETVRLTDEGRTGTVDAVKLLAALRDATEETEAYLRGRYVLPLASPPLLIKNIVAALARENLMRTRPVQAATDAAARARTQLRDLAAGRMELFLEEGEPEETGAALAAWGPSADARVFNAEKLDRF